MKVSKTLFTCLLCLLCFVGFKNVYAIEEVYYTNQYGVEFTEEEYDFFTTMFWDGYQNMVTQNEYQSFVDMDYLNLELGSNEIVYPPVLTRGSEVIMEAKKLKISKVCNTDSCFISMVATWLGDPTIRSYDVIGPRFSGVSVISTPYTRVISSDYTILAQNIQYDGTSGFGVSALLPTGSNVKLNQTYYVTKGGTVYGSYQHAMEDTYLSTSQQFTISAGGFGGVFNFYGGAEEVYDDMPGVDIAV